MENELLLSEIEEFEYPELELETFVTEDVLTFSPSNIEQDDWSDDGSGPTEDWS